MDPIKLKVGDYYHIDKDYRSGGKVQLLHFGKHFCVVKDPDTCAVWETMINRLSEWYEFDEIELKLSPELISHLEFAHQYKEIMISKLGIPKELLGNTNK